MPPRDERLSLDILRRVMPRKAPDPDEPPRDPTLLEVIVDDFYVGTVNEKPKDDDKRG